MRDKKLLFCLFYSALVLCVLAQTKNARSNYASFPANENGTCYKRVPYDEALAINISRGIVKASSGSQQSGVKTISDRGWVTIIDCCEGFIRNESTGNCETHCEDGCFGGTCTGPNICTCEDGWRPEAGVCKPICRRGCADNAYCFSPDICTCKFGYEEEEGVCKPVCRHGCKNGQCVAPRDCRCNPGYFLNETQRCEPVCEGGCPHGLCTEPGVCSCDHGYMNPENDQEACVPSCPDTCRSTMGQCHSPNVCTCSSGYTQTPSGTCIPECLGDCPNGRCVAPEQCECNQGFVWDHQLKGCIDAPKGQGGYYENSAVNRSYGNNYNNPTVPSETIHGGRGTYRPEDFSQQQGPNRGLKKPQSQQNYGSQQPGRAYGTQGVENRNRAESEEGDDYETTGSHGVIGLNQSQNNRGVIGLQGATYHPNENFNRTRNPHEKNYPYSGYGNNSTDRTHRPANSQGPFAPLEPYYPDDQRTNQTNPRDRNPPYESYGTSQTSRPQRPVNQQGPFPSQGPYPSRSYNGTHDLHENNGANYGDRRYNHTQRPYQGPYPSQSDNDTHDSHENNGTNYGDRRYNQTQRPYQGPYSSQRPHGAQGPYPGQRSHPTQETSPEQGSSSTPAPGQGLYPKLPPLPGQDPYSTRPSTSGQGSYDEQGPYPGQGPHPIQAPGQGLYPKLPRIPGQGPVSMYDRHDFESPHGPHYNEPSHNPQNPNVPNESNQPFKPQEHYDTPEHGQPGNPHETLGIKGPGRRPRPGTNRNPGLELAYGPNEVPNPPQSGNVNLRPGESTLIVGLFDPFNPPENDGTDKIFILEPNSPTPGLYHPFLPSPPQIDAGFAPFNPYAICEVPCINSVCVGMNTCQCKLGYEPDPKNPNGFQCIPSCPRGCVNGVCSLPNLCICNVGFVKERGIKGSQRCVPA